MRICILTEDAAGGNMARFIQERGRQRDELPTSARLPSAQACVWLVQIALALQHIHQLRGAWLGCVCPLWALISDAPYEEPVRCDCAVLHRDLAPKNILLTEDLTAKVSDFGLSCQMSCSQSLATSQVGTPYYMSPELLSGQKYGRASDVWSLGVIAFELLSLRRPFHGADMVELKTNVLASGTPSPTPSLQPVELCSSKSTRVLSATDFGESAQALAESGHPKALLDLVAPDALLLHLDPQRRMTLEALLRCLQGLQAVSPSTYGRPVAKVVSAAARTRPPVPAGRVKAVL